MVKHFKHITASFKGTNWHNFLQILSWEYVLDK